MKKLYFVSACLSVLTACGGFNSANPASANGTASSAAASYFPPTTFTANIAPAANVINIQMGCGYTNEPCVTVTVCSPTQPTKCLTIPDVLLDTGSYGLRVFNNNTAVASNSTMMATLGLTAVASGSGQVGECQSYLDGTSDWGPVVKANVMLGGETASNISMQVIDSTFAGVPSTCPQPDTAPNVNGYNGILGVGQLVADCGESCADPTLDNETYFTCTGSSCSNLALPTSAQVSNPVAAIPVDNNGVMLSLPAVPAGGVASLTGYFVLGIGTKSNNVPSGVASYAADSGSYFNTSFAGTNYNMAFIDSGSETLEFPPTAGVATCSDSDPYAPGAYCPSAEVSLGAYISGVNQSQNTLVTFQVGNASSYVSPSNPNLVFPDIAAPASGLVDWGLPFFLGRTVFVGIESASTPLGVGPLWGF